MKKIKKQKKIISYSKNVMLRLLFLFFISCCFYNCQKNEVNNSSTIIKSDNLKVKQLDSLSNYEVKIQDIKLQFKYLKNFHTKTLDSLVIENSNNFFIHKKYVTNKDFLYHEAPIQNIEMNSLELLIGKKKHIDDFDKRIESEYEKQQNKYHSNGQLILLENSNQEVYLMKFILYDSTTKYYRLNYNIYTVSNEFDASYKFRAICKLDKLMYYNDLSNTFIYSLQYECEP